jgi:hypothetical protein
MVYSFRGWYGLHFIAISKPWKPHKNQIGFAFSAKQRQTAAMQLQLDDVALFVRIAELGTL